MQDESVCFHNQEIILHAMPNFLVTIAMDPYLRVPPIMHQ